MLEDASPVGIVERLFNDKYAKCQLSPDSYVNHCLRQRSKDNILSAANQRDAVLLMCNIPKFVDAFVSCDNGLAGKDNLILIKGEQKKQRVR